MKESEWAVALDRFRGGYGGEPDLDDYTDRHLFLELLTYEIRASFPASLEEETRARLEPVVRAKIEADMAALFYAEAERINAETERLYGKAAR